MEEQKFKEVEEKPKTKRKGNQRPRIANKNRSIKQTLELQEKKEKEEKNNSKKAELDKQLEIIAQKFLDNPEEFYKQKEQEIAKLIVKYGDLQNEDLEKGIITKKDYSSKLTYYVTKPILGLYAVVPQYNAQALQMASEFYWEKVVLPLNEKIFYIPMLPDLLRILGISIATFNRYSTNGNEQMRETCQMIFDQFVSYYQRKGMSKEISEIMGMFVLKTTFKQRENDVPQVLIQNNNISSNDKIKKFAKAYGFDEYVIDD